VVARYGRALWLVGLLMLYLALTTYQLGLPGLHYDEAAEAGVNAMELLTGAPVTAFRGVAITLFGRQLPLMVQDYIGALNVYLALPWLALTGIGVPNLRILSVITGLLGLLVLERAISTWVTIVDETSAPPSAVAPQNAPPITLAALFTLTLLAAAPSFVFWSRQGIFVTNLTQPLCFWCVWQGLRWLHTGRASALLVSAFAGGLALYAKLLAVWIIGPFVLLAGSWWIVQKQRRSPLSWPLFAGAVVLFLLPLTPLLWFNLQTGGTLVRIIDSANQSYYGVDNLAWGQNMLTRSAQLRQVLQGDHLWYLGGIFGNPLAPWLALLLALIALFGHCRQVGPVVAVLVLAVGSSLFTVSDLFVTHYALLHPLAAAVVGISAAALWQARTRRLCAGMVGLCLLWLLLDLTATVRYHRALVTSGGLADHADTSYHLAYALRYGGLGAPIALDWGFAAPVRYLSEGRVMPIEIFGYNSLHTPDADFVTRLQLFLPNTANVYLLHAPDATVFAGRREIFLQESIASGGQPVLEQTFSQRDGQVLIELWRVQR
jgi:hypothetical protein